MERLLYISQAPHLENIRAACEAGCKWIQLRVKDVNGNAGKQTADDALHNVHLQLAIDAKAICDEFGAKLSINDNPSIAALVNAYGVHVGKLDVPVKEARNIVGDQSWVGGTANTLDDVLAHINDGVDYVGVGPFRFTTTKENLSPILGLEGYQQLMASVGSKVPVMAIGGILLEDIPALKEAGVYGVAVSGLITNAIDKKEMVQKINAIWNH
ncbi:thiamine phosphate synthase [Chitinophaga sp. SYP-B3965]|uniref:thiamine phosphate synthase n=1 Tax=Chitinophaga sp. SYP-B3965 TaxID=2663120 RepID=UPI0012996F65|nr:thiamine phosphate synthase [Chitinophaga sp. SYP-B3965]MRG46576.1 thiamine phosphate synthase [Chitinophaga sp. SYP-B3965]